MKYLLKISLICFAVFCFILACEQKKPAKLTEFGGPISEFKDTVPAGGVMP